MNIKKILYATDYSPGSRQALQFAAGLARQSGAKLLIVHVSDAEPYPVGELFEDNPGPDPQELAQLKSVVPDDPTVPYEHRLLYGEVGSTQRTKPAEVIDAFARRENVDLIVVGSHGRTGLRHMLMGSTAESILRHTCRPVVTIHLPSEAA